MQKKADRELNSKFLKQFIYEIQRVNRNPKNVKALELLEDLSTNPEKTLRPSTKLFRGRIVLDTSEINREKGFWGFGAQKSFVAPWQHTKDMRANYRYIPYLYCANNPYTALVEIRPRRGANVSIATIEVIKELKLLDFTVQNKPKRMSEAKFNLFTDLSYLFSKPIASDDDLIDYIPTQYIAEFSKNLGYDGIVFSSSLTPEINNDDSFDYFNIVVFNYNKCRAIKSNVYGVTNNYIDCQQIDDDTELLAIKNYIGEVLGRL